MNHLWKMFVAFCSRNRTYFLNNQQQVAENNLRMLRAALCVLLTFLVVYSLWTTFTIGNPLLAACYVMICAVVLALLLVTRSFRRHMPKPWMVQAACVVCV